MKLIEVVNEGCLQMKVVWYEVVACELQVSSEKNAEVYRYEIVGPSAYLHILLRIA